MLVIVYAITGIVSRDCNMTKVVSKGVPKTPQPPLALSSLLSSKYIISPYANDKSVLDTTIAQFH